MAHSKLYVKLMNSKEWRELRVRKIRANPLCEQCLKKGYITSARAVHHIIPVESGKSEQECRDLAFRYSNLMSVCFACHSEIHKTQRSYTSKVIKERQQERLSAWQDQMTKRFKNKQDDTGTMETD